MHLLSALMQRISTEPSNQTVCVNHQWLYMHPSSESSVSNELSNMLCSIILYLCCIAALRNCGSGQCEMMQTIIWAKRSEPISNIISNLFMIPGSSCLKAKAACKVKGNKNVKQIKQRWCTTGGSSWVKPLLENDDHVCSYELAMWAAATCGCSTRNKAVAKHNHFEVHLLV